MAKKSQATKIDGVEVSTLTGETVLLWKATRELSEVEHEQLSIKLKQEQEHAGIKIILVPLSVDLEVITQGEVEPAPEPDTNQEPSTEPKQGGDE
ncbi:hypothetical protein MHB77_29405 [Paenibacillus sp. FSL K6-3166]|uniref:hypothetical protein n=1 Tax=unclassified Paenibacillus TaxID=185978 RepID=UPI000BA138D4|nr:hypothetical protein [Paenibacillus sp. VTT E-133291]OZQ95843.1 hypothetical protein CA598_08420 [Paenibacillus sp. VTT E-133291]